MENEELNEGEEMEFDMEYISPIEYIQAAYFALSCVEDMDLEILPSEAAKKRIKRIKYKSLRILDKSVNDLYAEIFEDEDSSE